MTPAPAQDDRPRWARIAHGASLLELLVLACLYTWRGIANDASGTLWFPAVCAIASVGLWRRVSWGRFLFSAVSVLLMLGVVATLVPNVDDSYEGGPAFERLFGAMPPLAVCWLIIVGLATLILTPPVLVGWRRHWFRNAAW